MSCVGSVGPQDSTGKQRRGKAKPLSVLQKAWNSWVAGLPPEARASASEMSSAEFKFPYVRYDNLAVVNHKVLGRGVLHEIASRDEFREHRAALWRAVADALSVTHVGMTAPIPLDLRAEASLADRGASVVGAIGTADTDDASGVDAGERPRLDNGTNVLRSPASFRPLCGDFGPAVAAASPSGYSAEAARGVFWARASQYGVTQTWSPLHTMFSHGNVREKERVLGFGRPGGGGGGGDGAMAASTAVDLYAGIGYFAFCYRKAVADLVLCWEINPWSVEGFRRGAAANGWRGQLHLVSPGGRRLDAGEAFEGTDPEGYEHDGYGGSEGYDHEDGNWLPGGGLERGLVMFAESNTRAADRIQRARKGMPPVRHVNCGYLPTSEPVWEAAVRIVDPQLGGWIHAHENIAVKDIESRKLQVEQRFQELADRYMGHERRKNVRCANVARVKTYAPGVMHCVLDIHIAPSSE